MHDERVFPEHFEAEFDVQYFAEQFRRSLPVTNWHGRAK